MKFLKFAIAIMLVMYIVRWIHPPGVMAQSQLVELGKFPVCEPSAVTEISCPNSQGKCLLVGDNETKNSLFSFPIKDGSLGAKDPQILKIQQEEISDVEALTALRKDEVFMVGSHSRNKSCEVKPNRQRFLRAQVKEKDIIPLDSLGQTKAISSQLLIDGEALAKSKPLQKLAKAIDQAELAANQATDNQMACDHAQAFNIEGAVYLKDKEDSVWLGLRSPLVSMGGNEWAVLARLKNLNKIQFDQVVLLNLEGRGIRDLTQHDNQLWGIAGGPEDNKDNFFLWKTPLSGLKADAMVTPKRLEEQIPPSSEGLAISGDKAYVLVDGDRGEGASCEVPGKFLEISLK